MTTVMEIGVKMMAMVHDAQDQEPEYSPRDTGTDLGAVAMWDLEVPNDGHSLPSLSISSHIAVR